MCAYFARSQEKAEATGAYLIAQQEWDEMIAAREVAERERQEADAARELAEKERLEAVEARQLAIKERAEAVEARRIFELNRARQSNDAMHKSGNLERHRKQKRLQIIEPRLPIFEWQQRMLDKKARAAELQQRRDEDKHRLGMQGWESLRLPNILAPSQTVNPLRMPQILKSPRGGAGIAIRGTHPRPGGSGRRHQKQSSVRNKQASQQQQTSARNNTRSKVPTPRQTQQVPNTGPAVSERQGALEEGHELEEARQSLLEVEELEKKAQELAAHAAVGQEMVKAREVAVAEIKAALGSGKVVKPLLLGNQNAVDKTKTEQELKRQQELLASETQQAKKAQDAAHSGLSRASAAREASDSKQKALLAIAPDAPGAEGEVEKATLVQHQSKQGQREKMLVPRPPPAGSRQSMPRRSIQSSRHHSHREVAPQHNREVFKTEYFVYPV